MRLFTADSKIIRSLRGAIFTGIAVLLGTWASGDHQTITGLVDTVRSDWDSAGGAALIAFLAQFGFFSLPKTPTGKQS